MENKNERTPLNDFLIPRKTITVKRDDVKVVDPKDGLFERNNQKIVTSDGRQLLK